MGCDRTEAGQRTSTGSVGSRSMLVVMTEYRELLYAAAIAGFERPLLVETGRATRSRAGRTPPPCQTTWR